VAIIFDLVEMHVKVAQSETIS